MDGDYYTAQEIDQKLATLKIEMMKDIDAAVIMNKSTTPDPKKTQLYLKIAEQSTES